MLKHTRLPLVLALAATAVTVIALAAQAPPAGPRKAPQLYEQMCASCHGPNLAGGQAQSLLDDTWKFGGDDASLAKTIREGRPEAGMPPMGGALSEQEIRALVIFIREEGTKFARGNTTFAKPEANVAVTSERHAFKVETILEGVDTPWGLDFLPDGRMLVTEKGGKLRIAEKGTLAPQPIGGVPAVNANGQGGLLDVAVHPDYATNGWIYLSYSDPGANGSAMTAVVRGKLRDGQFVDQQTVFKAAPELYRTGPVHFGSRFVFDGKGHLFFSIGERGQKDDAQDVSRPNGKVHRINEDGSIPKDNPFVGKAGALGSIYSYGNRNAQGLALHPVTGELWEVEHGPRGGDEVNRIQPGRNYGWPVITYGMNYDGTPMTNLTAKEGMEQPVLHWTPSIAVSSIAFYTGDRFPEWKHNLIVASLAQQELRRLVLDGTTVTHQEVLFRGIGRIRDLIVGPDGNLYLAFNSPDRIARIVPADASSTAR